SGNRRLDTFVLGVGQSRDRGTHTPCATHTGTVAAGATVETTCEALGRYLSFRRSGGYEAQATALCEVVVIGYKYTSKLIRCD
ncbi:hypothetical protein LSAT2_003716, partial [Lamellibrachia satsuma]